VTPHPPGSSAPKLEVLEADERHAAEVASFIRQVWDRSATAEGVIAARRDAATRNVAEPGVPPPTWIALRAGRVLGYVTTIPVQLWDGQRQWPAYWIKGLMVLPEFRGGPIGFLVVKAAVGRLRRSGALAVAPPARRLFEALGYTDLGAIPNWIRPLKPDRLLRQLDLENLGLSGLPRWAPRALRLAQTSGLWALAWGGRGPLRLVAALARAKAAGLEVGPFEPSSATDALESLWNASRPHVGTGVVRDAGYLLQRYPTGPDSPYLWSAVHEHGRLSGFAVIRRPRDGGDGRLKGIRVATLADALYPPIRTDVGLALLGAAERTALSLDADAILATTSSGSFTRLLRRQWYFPLSGNVHLLLRDVAGEATLLARALPGWWLMRGDGQADEVF